MAEVPLSSGSNRIFPKGTTVQASGETQVAHYSRGRRDESGPGFQAAA